jgi:hypothetical protein
VAFPSKNPDVSLSLGSKESASQSDTSSFFLFFPGFDQLEKEENPKELTLDQFFFSFFPQDFLSQA